jgi:hypothetical protein
MANSMMYPLMFAGAFLVLLVVAAEISSRWYDRKRDRPSESQPTGDE